LKISSTGVIHGTPGKKLTPGSFGFDVTVRDATRHTHHVAAEHLTIIIS